MGIGNDDIITYNSTKDPKSFNNIYNSCTPWNGYVSVAYPPYHPDKYVYYHNSDWLGCIFYPYRSNIAGNENKYVVTVWNHVSGGFYDKAHSSGSYSYREFMDWYKTGCKDSIAEYFTFDMLTADTLYTSTRDITGKKDDGKSLYYSHSGDYETDHDITKFDNVYNIVEYIRPTTVLLEEQNTLNKITIGDIKWYAGYFIGKKDYDKKETVGPFYAFNAKECDHFSGWAAYDRIPVKFDTVKVKSDKLVDGAVRLLNKADVCVAGDVLDSTSTPYSMGAYTNKKTNAMLVVPGATDNDGGFDNFRLKVGGDLSMLITQDSGRVYDNPFEAGYMYMASAGGVGPGAAFPTAQVPVKLSNGTQPWNEVQGLIDYKHPRGSILTDVNNADAEKRIPYFATKGSVFGVHGAYNGNNDIHTQNINKEDVPSIIEIGSATTNQDKFHVYSSGMLKNYRSDCNTGCETLVVGLDGKAPEFKITQDDKPLYIINDGNCCNAGIKFNGPGVTSLNSAITGAQGSGDLHIQANKFIQFLDVPVAFTLSKDNEVKVLSDNGYIYSNMNFAFTNADKANLTLWAKGGPDTQRGCTDLSCNTGAIQSEAKNLYKNGIDAHCVKHGRDITGTA